MNATIAMLLLAAAPIASLPTPHVRQEAPAAQLFVVLYSPGPAWIAGKPMHEQKLGGHVVHIRKLLAEGVLVAGGPYTDRDGGMALIRAASAADAQAIVTADPAVRDGVFVADVRPWDPRFDSKQPLVR